MLNKLINIDPVYGLDRVMVQIDDHEEGRVHILGSSYVSLDEALNAASEFLENK